MKARVFFFTPLFIFPLLILLHPLFAVYYVIFKCLKSFKPELGKTLEYPATCFLEDFKTVPRYGFSFLLVLDGTIPIERLRQVFTDNVLNLTENGGKRYPELQQYLCKFMGQAVWKKEEGFSLSEHVFEGPSSWRNLPLDKIFEETLNTKFLEDKSPWMLISVPNYTSPEEDEKTLMVLYFHHTLADAKSAIKLLIEALAQTKLTTARSQWNPKKGLKFYLLTPFYIFIGGFNCYREMWGNLRHSWRGKNTGECDKAQIIRLSSKFPLEDIKKIAGKFKTSTSSVIMGILAGAVRRSEVYPRRFLCVTALEKPNHPATLTNHFYHAMITLPCDMDTFPKRVAACQKELTGNKTFWVSIAGFFSFLTNFLNCSIKTQIFKDQRYPFGAGYTCVAGESLGFSIDGKQCSYMMGAVAIGETPIGVVFAVLSYKGSIQYSISARPGLLPEETVEALKDNLSKEYEFALSL